MNFSNNSNQINLGLERILALLARLKNPHLNLPPTIHIAGTNGKGSTLAFLRAIFAENGLKVHTYTSPHLVKFNERIVLAGKEISDQFLQECLDECRIAIAQNPPLKDVTFFEETTAAAFLAFSRVSADLLLLETGLGGRLDATNVLPKILAAIITPIDFDHIDFLGETLPKIAAEKAGILKENCPVFVGKQKVAALRVLENKARELDCEMKVFGKDWSVKKQKNGFKISGTRSPSCAIADDSCTAGAARSREIFFPLPSLPGAHQIDNAALAVACALSLNFPIDVEKIKSALTKTFWPARLQKISSGKFFEILPKNCELYLDGSHNLQGAITVKKFLQQQKDRKKILIFATMSDKNYAGFLQKIAPEIDEIIALNFAEESRAAKPQEIIKIAEKLGAKSIIAQNFDEAFAKIKNEKQPILALVCGSLYLAGNFLKKNCKLEKRF
jgi:dihydrofolate synthase/folylpolyglutamate synthase